jgi:uncharacterized protein YecT (DUF1311 family)
MNCTTFIVFSSLCFSTNVFAIDCNNLPAGIGPDAAQASLQCAEHDRAVADRALNDTYRKLRAQLNNNRGAQALVPDSLLAAQRAWVAFRDTECDFRASLSGAAPQWLGVNRTECLTALTTARVRMLKDYLEDAQ